MYVIPGRRWFWSLFAYLEMVCTLNLEMSACWPTLSKFEWFQKGNTAFCFSRQHSSSSINQSTNCLGILTVTHADASFLVTIVLILGKQRKAHWEKEMTRSAWPWQPFIWSQQRRCWLPSEAVVLFCHVIILSNPPLKEPNSKNVQFTVVGSEGSIELTGWPVKTHSNIKPTFISIIPSGSKPRILLLISFSSVKVYHLQKNRINLSKPSEF